MSLLAWMYDLARDQSPGVERLEDWLRRSAGAGYNALGLYLEHRFAYPSASWAAADGALTPDEARAVARTARRVGVRLIPFLNTLGHMEGFIGSRGGAWLAEGSPDQPLLSLQMCPSRGECRDFARALVADALAAFDDEWVHLGGDETRQLGQCSACAERVARLGPGGLYGEYCGDLCRWVLDRGRRPCLWADMVLQHPDALACIPRETVLFDWQYDKGPADTTSRLRAQGFDVVCCPALHTFDSAWCFLGLTQQNADQHAVEARERGAAGLCLTTWEFTGLSSFESVLPLVMAVARRWRGAAWHDAIIAEGGADYAVAAEILGREIPAAAAFLAPGTWRQLRRHLVFSQNPFRLWLAWRDEAPGDAGERVLSLCNAAERVLPAGSPLHYPIELHRRAVGWVRDVQAAGGHYTRGESAACVAALERGAAQLERLRPFVEAAALGGGSRVDGARLDVLLRHVAEVVGRIQALDLAGGRWLPAFEWLVMDGYVPGEQSGWGVRVR